MVKVNPWWEKGFRYAWRVFATELKSRKDQAWEDYEAHDDTANGYRLGFYQGILHVYESLEIAEHEAHSAPDTGVTTNPE